jgi:hypothetical protein
VIKNKALVIVTILVLVLSVVAMSCAPAAAPAAKPATTAPAATTTPAATTPPSTPPTPPGGPSATAPAATAPAKLSFDATTFTSDKSGFTFQYPKSWATRTKAGYEVYVQDGDETTADTAFVVVVPKSDDLAGAAKAYLDGSETFKKYEVKCDIVSQKKGTLADGKTPCTQAVLHVTIIIYSINIYAVGATKGDNSILAIAYTFGTKTEKIQEICNTLSFK